MYKIALYDIIDKQLSFRGYLDKHWKNASDVCILNCHTIEERNIAYFSDFEQAMSNGNDYCNLAKEVTGACLLFALVSNNNNLSRETRTREGVRI